MAAVATERIDGRTVKTNSASIKYNVETDGDALAASAIAARRSSRVKRPMVTSMA